MLWRGTPRESPKYPRGPGQPNPWSGPGTGSGGRSARAEGYPEAAGCPLPARPGWRQELGPRLLREGALQGKTQSLLYFEVRRDPKFLVTREREGGIGPFPSQTARGARPEVPPCLAPTAAARRASPRMRARLSAAATGYPEGDPHPHRRATHPGSRFPAAPTACGHRQAVRRPGRPRRPAPGRYGQASWKVQQRRQQHRQPWLFARKPTGRPRAEAARTIPAQAWGKSGRTTQERLNHEWAEAVELAPHRSRMRDMRAPCAEQWICPLLHLLPALPETFIHSFFTRLLGIERGTSLGHYTCGL